MSKTKKKVIFYKKTRCSHKSKKYINGGSKERKSIMKAWEEPESKSKKDEDEENKNVHFPSSVVVNEDEENENDNFASVAVDEDEETLDIAKQKIGKFMINAHKKIEMENQRLAQISKIRKSIYGRKITKFMHNTTQKRREMFLKAICADSGVCIAFGQEEHKIKEFFNGFTKFDFVYGPIQRRGVPSVNGFIHEIAYSKGGYNAFSILKSSSKTRADNLYYEFEVGRYLNTIHKKIPCFVETYGLFTYNDIDSWRQAKDNVEILPDVFSTLITHRKDMRRAFKISCNDSLRISIMTQHIKNAETLNGHMQHQVSYATQSPLLRQEAEQFVQVHLPAILFQIYFALSLFMERFTHYDLHTDNVLLYIPVQNKYIQYHYHNMDSSITSFKSKYLVKIIDYGRSYFKDDSWNVDSKKAQWAVCNEPDCNTSVTGKCGENVGYTWLFPENPNLSNNFLTSWRRNISHDLRLLDILLKNYGNLISQINPGLMTILQKIIFNEFYGTQELVASGLPGHIHNVMDAYIQLQELTISSEIVSASEGLYADPTFSKLGDLHIYSDGRSMEYTPV